MEGNGVCVCAGHSWRPAGVYDCVSCAATLKSTRIETAKQKVYNRSNRVVVYKFSPSLVSIVRNVLCGFFCVLTLFPRTRVAYFENFCNIESERILRKVLFIYLEEKKTFRCGMAGVTERTEVSANLPEFLGKFIFFIFSFHGNDTSAWRESWNGKRLNDKMARRRTEMTTHTRERLEFPRFDFQLNRRHMIDASIAIRENAITSLVNVSI